MILSFGGKMNNKRIVYLDMLKIISCIAVVVIHVTAPGFKELNIHTASWSIMTVFNILARFAVPVFVMVSGALFLNQDKDVNIKRLYKKNILHLAIIYIIWTLIYSIYNVYNKDLNVNVVSVLKDAILKSYYHLWFIPMLIGIYICIPLLKPIVASGKKTIEYFLIIFVILKVIPTTILLFKFPYSSYIAAILNRIDVPMLSYIGYFVLGHYLHTYELNSKQKRLVYVLGIIATILGIVGTIAYSLHMDKAIETLCREFSITTFIMSIAIFVVIKSLFEKVNKNIKLSKDKNVKLDKLIIHVSNMSLGIYLTHALFRDILKNQIKISFTNIWYLPLNIIIVLVVSYIASYIISKIPFVNKYLI